VQTNFSPRLLHRHGDAAIGRGDLDPERPSFESLTKSIEGQYRVRSWPKIE
jgi:hypothetical protein